MYFHIFWSYIFLSSKRKKLDNMPRKEYDVRKKNQKYSNKTRENTPTAYMYIFSIKLKWLEIQIHVLIKYKKFHNRAVRQSVGQLKCYLNYVNLYCMNKNRSIYIPLIYGNLLPHRKNMGKQLVGKYFFFKDWFISLYSMPVNNSIC